MSAAAPKLLYAAGVVPLARSASGIMARAARGFQVFRVDGYSWTTTVPVGERITSDPFPVGGRHWFIDYYPNGDDMSKVYSNSISLHLRLHAAGYDSHRVRAQYKFSLLDLAGNAAYELPAAEGTFVYDAGQVQEAHAYGRPRFPEGSACGHREFITKEELERRRDVLLRDDCLAIRCDVGVVQLDKVSVAPTDSRIISKHHSSDDDDSDSDSDDDSDGESRRRRQRQRQPKPMDDSEFVRRCLAQNRRA